jgi:uncharacterized DUF497 family protein
MRIEAIMEFDEGHLEQFYKLFADDRKVRIINVRRVTEQEMQRWERELELAQSTPSGGEK